MSPTGRTPGGDAQPAPRETGEAGPRVEPLSRHLPRRHDQAGGQRQGGFRRQRLRPPQGLHLPRGRRHGVPLPQHPRSRSSPPRTSPPSRPRRSTRASSRSTRASTSAAGSPTRATPGHWQAKDFILAYDGKSEAKEKDLWTEKDVRRLRADRRLAAPGQAGAAAAAGGPPQRRRRHEPRRLAQDARHPLRRRQRHPAPRPRQGAGQHHLQHHRLG